MASAFRCLRCGACCRSLYPLILLSDIELWVREGAWHILEAVVVRGAEGSLRRLGVEKCFTFRRRGGSCYFYRGGLCSIYELRPMVCRLFPFSYAGDGISVHPWARRNCPGVRLWGGVPPPELEELAERVLRELVGLPYYSTFVEELLSGLPREGGGAPPVPQPPVGAGPAPRNRRRAPP